MRILGREYLPLLSLLFACSLTVACSERTGRPGGGGRDAGPGVRRDGAVPPGTDGGGSVNACNPGCGPMELCGDGEGNGLDDDCNGMVDETCTCTPGAARPCFGGAPDRHNLGSCADGVEYCGEFTRWGDCIGDTLPTDEVCDGADNDCNAITDDIAGCTSVATCPENESAPPLSTYPLRGARVYGGTGTSWTWTIGCPAEVPAALCPAPSMPNARDSDVYFTASGAYRVGVTVVTDTGETISCAWTVYVQGTGLRVELNWDTMLDTAGGTDVDLHLHRWTSNDAETNFYDAVDDCYYANCQPDDTLDWPGHANSDVSICQDAPHGGGPTWRSLGYCRNPRLDVDTNGTDGPCSASETDPQSDAFCAPENINVDVPIMGQPYRIVVDYYNDHGFAGDTHPEVNIYCGGALRGSFGRDPFVTLRNGSDYGAANDNWLVADVVFFEGTCGIDCMVYPIGLVRQGMADPSDPFGISATLAFDPPWSCAHDPGTMTCTAR